MSRLWHQLHHLVIGVVLVVLGVELEKVHRYHHGSK
jgi:hypothetical protein